MVLPCLNEGENLSQVVESGMKALRRLDLDFEIIIVDDGSTDDTWTISQKLQEASSRIKAERHERNRGYGAALRSGFAVAEKHLVFFTDADGQFRLDDLGPFLQVIGSHDMVIGYRENRKDPLWRKWNSRIGNLLARTFLNVRVRDINCAFKLFHRNKLLALPLAAEGAFINTELLALAQAAAWTCKEIPVRHFPRLHGKPTGGNPSVILKTFREYYELGTRLQFSTGSSKRLSRGRHTPHSSQDISAS